MDDDIKEHLKELQRHIEDIARQVGSTKSNLTSIMSMSECLRTSADTLDTYVRIQKDRYL